MKPLRAVAAAIATLFALALVPMLGSLAHADVGRPDPTATATIADVAKPPSPWKTAVRIKVTSGLSVVIGSGTVVDSTADRSVILTCAHLFDKSGGKVKVDLFGDVAEFPAGKPGLLKYRETHPGKVLSVNPVADLALVEIRPGRMLDASPVAPEGYQLAVGQQLTAIGCGFGADATIWSTSVVGFGASGGYRYTECMTAPRQGRSGGGLYTPDGIVVGVCDFARGDTDRGLYAAPEAIRAELNKLGLKRTHAGVQPCPGRGCPNASPGQPSQAPEPHFHLRRPPAAPEIKIEIEPIAPQVTAPAPPQEFSFAGTLARIESAVSDEVAVLGALAGGVVLLLKRKPSPTTLVAA